jgi:hypothetical protein
VLVVWNVLEAHVVATGLLSASLQPQALTTTAQSKLSRRERGG